MDERTDSLLQRLHEAEQALEREFDLRREALSYRLERGKAVFEQRVVAEHRRLRTGLLQFLASTSLRTYASVPFVFALIVPLAFLDLSVTVYQAVCFRLWGIRRVRRADHVVVDRHRLAYLNGIEKLNCVYCGYANGVIAFTREVASRTEQYWCPIKHALRVKGAHSRYRGFLDYGDAEGLRRRSDDLRDDLKDGKPQR
ncbi:MAG: hypothetical protein RLO51_06150 [Thalassobaculum sp.]|uniref:hypothetical protein n=1 Tax=Thalassobaculum sp. TaxID=2022740 RepID=UPI0032ED05ED